MTRPANSPAASTSRSPNRAPSPPTRCRQQTAKSWPAPSCAACTRGPASTPTYWTERDDNDKTSHRRSQDDAFSFIACNLFGAGAHRRLSEKRDGAGTDIDANHFVDRGAAAHHHLSEFADSGVGAVRRPAGG